MKAALRTLNETPPTFGVSKVREAAFLKLGEFFESSIRIGGAHDLVRKPNAVWREIETRLLRVLVEIACPTDEALVLWQMYNSGVIIKSDEVIMGLDVIPMLRTYGWDEPIDLTQQVARTLDFLLITHRHPDHYDKKLVRACLDMGMPVCMPESLAWEWETNVNLHAVSGSWEMDLNDIHIKGRKAFHVWREDIEDVPSVYYEVPTQTGYSFIFSGDADYTKVFEKTPDKKIDLLFLPWRNPNAAYEDGEPGQIGTTMDAVQVALDRVKPGVVLYEHYAELEHVYNGFPASYDIVADLKEKVGVPSEWLFWGERLDLA